MRVNEYIYRNWANWNFAILKELCEDEGIEWSEKLVAYLKTTPTNTNWSLLKDFGIEPYGTDEDESDMVTITFIEDEEWKIEDPDSGEQIESPYVVAVNKGTSVVLPQIVYAGSGSYESLESYWTTEKGGAYVQGLEPYNDYVVNNNITLYANGQTYN